MARLLVAAQNSWYDELNSVAYYGETEFEKFIQQHIQSIFPEFYAFPFKKTILNSSGTGKRPDLAMVRKNYDEWWIIEAELAEHSLQHVLEQTRVFRYGEYNPLETADYMHAQIKREHKRSLNLKKLKALISKTSPSVLVIVDASRGDWLEELRKIEVELCIFEVYKNTKGYHAYRLEGNYPIVRRAETHCRYHRTLPNILEIHDATVFGPVKVQDIKLFYNGKLTRWRLFQESGGTYLRFLGGFNPLPADSAYVIYKDINNNYYIRKN